MLVYRTILGLAAAYNVAFGIWAGFFPESFFELFDLPPPRYPSIWACVGMVVGVYAIAYTFAAWRPERGDVLVAIGLLGKVLGPLGWLHAVWTGELPPRTFPIILANDLIWWFPFLFYLLRRLQRRRTIVAWTAVVLHVIACVGLLAVHGGTEAESDFSERLRWVTGAARLWIAVWLSWSLASMSLLAFCTVWSARLHQLGSPRLWVIAGCVTCAAGLAFDLAGETVNIVRLTWPGLTLEEFVRSARLYTLLGPAVANGLYCVAGLLLSCVSWRIGFLREWLGCLGIHMWIVGLLLTMFAILDHHRGMVLAGGAVMTLFIPWAAGVSWQLRAAK